MHYGGFVGAQLQSVCRRHYNIHCTYIQSCRQLQGVRSLHAICQFHITQVRSYIEATGANCLLVFWSAWKICIPKYGLIQKEAKFSPFFSLPMLKRLLGASRDQELCVWAPLRAKPSDRIRGSCYMTRSTWSWHVVFEIVATVLTLDKSDVLYGDWTWGPLQLNDEQDGEFYHILCAS